MSGYFVWRVRGEHDTVEAKREREKPWVDRKVDVELQRQAFDCMVLTRDPAGRDVASLALLMRIGAVATSDWNPTIAEMTCIGWAQGEAHEIPEKASAE